MRKEEGGLNSFGGRMLDEGSVTVVPSTFVATRCTLTTDWAFLIALHMKQDVSKHESQVHRVKEYETYAFLTSTTGAAAFTLARYSNHGYQSFPATGNVWVAIGESGIGARRK